MNIFYIQIKSFLTQKAHIHNKDGQELIQQGKKGKRRRKEKNNGEKNKEKEREK